MGRGGNVLNPMTIKLLALTIPRMTVPRAVLLACFVVILSGCSTAPKKNEPKELAKLSLDCQEEAQKLRDEGNLQASAAKYQEALRYHPSPSVHYELGDVLERLGKNNEAKAQYDLALARNPNMPEATQALERLDAKMELADRSMQGGPAAPLSRSSSTEQPPPSKSTQTADTTPASGNPPPPEDQLDVFDEDRKFREMSELKPPPPSEEDLTAAESPASRPKSGEDVDSLLATTEELYASERGTSEVYTEKDQWEPTEDEPVPTSKRAGSKRTAEVNPARNKPLRGGRGLLNSLDTPPDISVAAQLPSSGERHGENEPVFIHALATEPAGSDARDGDDLITKVSGKPGERGLSSRKRLPSEAPVPLDYERKAKTTETRKPSFTSEGAAPPPSSPPVKKETTVSEPVEDTREKKGFLSRIFSPDEITYPEPPTPEVEKALPSPYGREREELDLRPFHAERLKGKRKIEYEIQTCKDRYYKEKDLEGAIRCFNDKKIDFPENPQIYYELGLILEDCGDYSLARKNLELAIRYDPNNEEYKKAVARLDVGRAKELRVNGNYAGAQAILKKTVEKYPDMVEAHRELGLVYSADALAKERGAEVGTPASPNLGEIINQTWLYAEQAYQEVVNLTEGDYKDWYNLGVAIQKQNRDDKRSAAVKAYEKSISLNPEYPNAHYHLGILYESSNVAAAIRHYEIALSQARRMPRNEGQDLVIKCLGSLGELNWRIGNKDKAAEYLTEYIQFAPGDAYIEEMLNQITTEPTNEG